MRERTRVLPAASLSLARAMNLLPAFPHWRDSVVHGVVNQLGERVHSQLVHQPGRDGTIRLRLGQELVRYLARAFGAAP